MHVCSLSSRHVPAIGCSPFHLRQTDQCPCDTTVDIRRLQTKFRSSDLLPAAERPAQLRPPTCRCSCSEGASRFDAYIRTARRPDGLILIPWQGRRSLTWNVTVVDIFAASYLATQRPTRSLPSLVNHSNTLRLPPLTFSFQSRWKLSVLRTQRHWNSLSN